MITIKSHIYTTVPRAQKTNNDLPVDKSDHLLIDNNQSDIEVEKIERLVARIQPKGSDNKPPILEELNSLLAQSIRNSSDLNHVKGRIDEILQELEGFQELISKLKEGRGLSIKKYSHRFLPRFKIFARKINLEYLALKISKLRYLAKETLEYCTGMRKVQQVKSSQVLLTELAVKVTQIENHRSNPVLDEHISKFGAALTLAARTSADDLNPWLKEEAQPQYLNGVIAGFIAGGADIIGSYLSESETIFKKMDVNINKNILLMRIQALLRFASLNDLRNCPVWNSLELRIDSILGRHTRFSTLPSKIRRETTSSQLKQQIIMSAVTKQDSVNNPGNMSIDPVVNMISPVINDVLHLEECLMEFSKHGNRNNLSNSISAHIGIILQGTNANNICNGDTKVTLADYIWEILNSHKYYRRSKSDKTVRQKYTTPLDMLLLDKNGCKALKPLVENLSHLKHLVNTDYITTFNGLHRLLETTTKPKVIQTMYVVRLLLQNNDTLTAEQKVELYTQLFHKRLSRDHGNLRRIANGGIRKDGLTRKFAIDFFRYCLHNSSTIEAGLPQHEFAIGDETLNFNVNDLTNQIVRWNAFQNMATMGRTNFTNEVIVHSHTFNTIEDLYKLHLDYFNANLKKADRLKEVDESQQLKSGSDFEHEQPPKCEEETEVKKFELELQQRKLDFSRLEIPELAPVKVKHDFMRTHSLLITVHKQHSPHMDLEGEEEIEVEVKSKNEDDLLSNLTSQSIIEDQEIKIPQPYAIKSGDKFSGIEEESKQEEEIVNIKEYNLSNLNLLQYKFNRLQDLTEDNISGKKKATLPYIVHIILAAENKEDKVELIKNFYKLSQVDPHIREYLNPAAENCSITEFDKLITNLLSSSSRNKLNIKYNPLVILTLLYGCVMKDQNDDTRSEKLGMLNEMIEDINDKRSILFEHIAPSTMKTFVIEMTLSCVCASLYAVAYAFTFPFAIIAQLVINWLRISANDSRTITFLSRKLITTNREKALRNIDNIVKGVNQDVEIFRKDLKQRNLQVYIPITDDSASDEIKQIKLKREVEDSALRKKIQAKFKREVEDSVLREKIQAKLRSEAENIIKRLKESFPVSDDTSKSIVSPAEFLFTLDTELGLSLNSGKNSLMRKLLLLRQIIAIYPFNKISPSNPEGYKAIILASILHCLRVGVIAPTLRQTKASGYDAFIAPGNLIASITTLIPKVSSDIFLTQINTATLSGIIGDAVGTLGINMLATPAKKHPKGYRRVMKIFKNDIFNLDLAQIENEDEREFLRAALGIHTNSYFWARWGQTTSLKYFNKR